MKYLVLGAGGMAGHMICHYLIECGEVVEGLSRKELPYIKTHILDVSQFKELEMLIVNNNFDYIINCIGVLNEAASNDRDKAILINSYLPHFLVGVTKKMNTRIIQMSTDCVFSGEKGDYNEQDYTDGKSFYDRTKALGELKDEKNLTFRNSIIGPDIKEKGIGLFNWFMMQENDIKGFEKSIWTGVTTLTLAKAMYEASHQKLTGLYNLVNNKKINKFDLLILFKKYANKNINIEKVDGISHDKSLVNTRNDFIFEVPSYESQIKEMVEWIDTHKELYPHYFKK